MIVDLALMGHVEHRAVTIGAPSLVEGLKGAYRNGEWVCDFGATSVYMIQPHKHRHEWPDYVCVCGLALPGAPMIESASDADADDAECPA